MTGNTDLIKSVSSEIVRFFSRGFVAGGDVLHFACSALDVTACEEIAAILADGDREQSGLSELVFHPPAEFRSGIEEFLPPEGVRPEIENKILVACECGIGVTRISFACCGLAAECPVTRDMLRAFTSALHLGNPVRCDILYAAELNADTRRMLLPARSLLRRCRYPSNAEREWLLRRLVERQRADPHGDVASFMEVLAFVLRLFGTYGADAGCAAMLAAEKRIWKNALHAARKFEEECGRYSMDMLMSFRITPPAIHCDEARRNIFLADLVSAEVYGKPADSAVDVVDSATDNIDTRRADWVAAMVEFFSGRNGR